ncbi:MAG TPA: DPP IV N-terminal domain-containing protein, partial [Pirellulaceae bacterium]|nr:DPP IV N-terminal domain-containing protein [Pirellulaceae bacterium]
MHLSLSTRRGQSFGARGAIAVPVFLAIASMAANFASTASAADPDPSLVRLALDPDLSPDGGTLAFSWRGDIWTVSSNGGTARRITLHDAQDRYPKFSPDGNELAFISDRDGSPQVYAVSKKGGQPRQITHHTAGYQLEGWYPDGQGLLVSAQRDHFWKKPERFFRVSATERTADQLLFDDYGGDGALSPDGKRLLFTREGPAWWRKGYRGSQAAQIWLYDLQEKKFSSVINQPTGARFPLWKPTGDGFYFVSSTSGSQNLWEHDLKKNESRQLTKLDDDSVVFPCLSRDGSTIVF